ncbi:hypothetical protein WJX72_009883 [[Myrmecia] bisecta]|uniref:DUF3531 domain-containing protein n=1 Tax=[Myrmecia] bisecta TaxID=41462 RepID=A0AAW1QB77_9CHLO
MGRPDQTSTAASCLYPGRPPRKLRCSRPAASSHLRAAAVKEKPEWVRQYEADVENDPEIAELLRGTNGDPDLIQKRIDESMRNKHREIMSGQGGAGGQQQQMQVKFRQVDPFNLWLWLELYDPPSIQERQLLEEVLSSWFMLGRLGGFNGMNLQVFHKGSDESSYMDYDAEECESALQAFFHDMSNLETQGNWCRCWLNMGTADEMALDILINALSNFSRENVGIKRLVIGGKNDDWDVPAQDAPKVTMDPMRTPLDMDMDTEDY